MADEEYEGYEEEEADDVVRCPKCWSRDIAPALARGFWDRLMLRRSLVPCQCRFCAHRFYRPGDPAEYRNAWPSRLP